MGRTSLPQEVSRRRFVGGSTSVRALALVFVLAAASACSSGDDDKQNSTGGTGGIAGSGGTGGTGGTGGDPGTGGTGGDPGTGGTGGDPGTGGTGGDPGTGGTGGDPGTGGTGGDPGTGGTGGDAGTGGTGGDGGTGGTGGFEDPDPVVVRVVIDPDSLDLVELDRLVLKATAYDADDQEIPGLPVAWRSSNQAVVRVTADGSLFAAGAGSATITATIEDVESQAEVTVTAGVVVGVSVEAPPTSTLTVGDSILFSARVTDAQDRLLPGRAIEWSSSDPLVATVDPFGWVMAVRPGTATITATVGDVQGHAVVEVARAAGSVNRRLAMGEEHTCYLDDEGSAWCWGTNWAGQLGDGSDDSSYVPVPVATGLTFVSIAAGSYSTCALTGDGEIYCWGGDYDLLLGGNGDSLEPVLVDSGPYAFLTLAYYTGCALDAEGYAFCWGYASGDYELGNDVDEDSPFLVPVAAPPGEEQLQFAELKGGEYQTCGLTVDLRLFCWGYNTDGQLGVGHRNAVDHPVEVFPGQEVTAFGVGYRTGCATANGVSYCWGKGTAGQIGNGTSPSRALSPLPISSGVEFVDFTGGYDFICGLDIEGHAWCWGYNDSGQLGNDGPDVTTPVAVSGGLTFSSIFARNYQACGIADDGVVYCWGENWEGQLGIGPDDWYVYEPTPVQW